ncbi:uncharacterized protein LOC143750397 isoform X3 [Siphateles boraxobius]|uniref:uncharacterized protein LOC143750397 isoform X3 n=1 Tax=Siphateles boraxobius TaxID=180520 RepID=UPI0040646FFC
MKPTNHLFLMRNLLHHYNVAINTRFTEQLTKAVGCTQVVLDEHGQALAGTLSKSIVEMDDEPSTVEMDDEPSTVEMDDEPSTDKASVTWLEDVMPNKTGWEQPFSEEKLTRVLDTKQNGSEHVARVYSTTLMRKDFQTLGLERNVEATILNCCFKKIEDLSKLQGIQVWTSNSYVNATLIPPLCADPMLHIPVDASTKDCILFPLWIKSHWMLCVSLTGSQSIRM